MNDEQYEELLTAVSGLSVLVKDMRTDIQELKTGQNELKRNQDELKRNQDELKRNQDELKQSHRQLQGDVAALTQTVEQYNSAVMSSLAERIAQDEHLSTRVGRLEERVLRLELGQPVKGATT